MKRIAVFVFYDEKGIVDRYVEYLLSAVREVAEYLLVMSNVSLIDAERHKLDKYASEIVERTNIGFDAGAYKDAICTVTGAEKLKEYDEMLLCNDTVYGPFISMASIFEKMAGRELDFWGITKHFANGKYPEHIQSWFLVISENLLHSEDFMEFWASMEYPGDYQEAIGRFELAFTGNFADKGYTYDTYVELGDEQEKNEKNNYNFCMQRYYYLLKMLHAPFLKKKSLILKLEASCDARKSLEWIKRNTDYDISMIWENALRIYNLTELNRALHPHFILGNIGAEDSDARGKAAVAVYLRQRGGGKNVEKYVAYLVGISDICQIYISVTGEETYQRIKDTNRYGWHITRDEGSGPIGFLFHTLKNEIDRYQYIALLHDCATLSGGGTPTDERIIMHRWDSLLGHDLHVGYIGSVASLFENNEEIGFLAPTRTEKIFCRSVNTNDWKRDYPEIITLLSQLGISVPCSEKSEPYVDGDMFWARKDALKQMWGYEAIEAGLQDAPVCEQTRRWGFAMPYIAQSNGYMTAKLEDMFQAAMICDLDAESMPMEEAGILLEKLLNFCGCYDRLYIYGAGRYGMQTGRMLLKYHIEFEAFVVSDEEWNVNSGEKLGHPVLSLSMSDFESDNAGYIVALGVVNTEAVMPVLKEKGIKNLYTLQ